MNNISTTRRYGDFSGTGFLKALKAFFPAGGTLPTDVWRSRHQFLLLLTWFHSLLIAMAGPVLGYTWELSVEAVFREGTVLHTTGRALVVAFFAAIATWGTTRRTIQASAVGLGLMSASAILVYLSRGYIGLYFHFFVMIIFLTFYQDWVPIIMGILYVVIHHGVIGVLWPEGGVNHPAAFDASSGWAAIHAFFVLLACVGSIIAWRYNEKAYAQAAASAQKFQRVLERIRALHEIGKAVTSTLDLQAVLKVLMEKIDDFFPSTAVLVWLIDPASGTVERTACWNLDEADWKGRKLSGTPSLVQAAIESRAPVVARNVQTDPRTLDPHFYRRNGLVSYLGVPLMVRAKVLGVLVFLTRKDHDFTDEEIDLLTSLAGQAAVAIHNSQLHEQTQTSRRELEMINRRLERLLQEQAALYAALTPLAPADTLNQMLEKVIDRLMEATAADAAMVRMRDNLTGEFTYAAQRGFPDYFLEVMRTKSTGSAIGQVFESGEPLIVSDIAADRRVRAKLQVEAGFRSCVFLPLKVRNQVRGVVLLSSRELGHFDAEQEAHLMAIVRQMGIAIENRGLFDEIHASKAELERANQDLKRKEEIQALLKELNQDITRLDIDTLLKKLTEKVREILRVDISDMRILVEGQWKLTGISGIDPNLLTSGRSGTGRGPAGWIQKHRQPLVIPDLNCTDIPTGTTIKSLGLRGYVGVPLFSRGGEVIGVLRGLSYQLRDFTHEEVDLLQQLANGSAVALENARLLEEIKRQAVELEKSNKAKDELLDIMARQQEELSRLNTGLEREIAERTRARAEIAAKNRDLETLLYVTSHDLREPLRAIENFSRLVNDRYHDRLDEKGQDFLRRVIQGAQRLNRLLDDILILSRSQRMGVPTEEVEGETIVLEALRRLEGKVNATGAQIRVAKDFHGLRVDKTWATQAVYNLIANALKFTRNGEAPDVEIVPYQPQGPGSQIVGIAVSDRGPGVAPEHAERIFQLFQRAVGREVEGTGAGLAIVRQIAERHGGSAWVEAREGGGSEFIITFGQAKDLEGGNNK